MQTGKATAVARPNIALIKYWGNRDHALRLPANSSLSMNMAPLPARCSYLVELKDNLRQHAIPEGVFNHLADDYDRFLEERRKSMAARIRDYFKTL